MKPHAKPNAPELLRPRLEVLKSGLQRLRIQDGEGIGTIRRMAKVLLNWAIGEGFEEVEKAAFLVVGAKDSDVLEAGDALAGLLDEIVGKLEPGESEDLVILAVEDNPDDALLLEVALASPGRTLQVARSGAEAEEVLKSEDVALMVLDLSLPDTDGETLLLKARGMEGYEELTVLIVSGKSDPETKAECLALGANGFFEKPVDPTIIATTASTALHREAKRRFSLKSDPLTHLLNRNAIRELWERWTFPDPSSVGILGIDDFRALEDRFDHEVADRVIAACGSILRNTVPRGAVAARWGESEFLVLFPGSDRQTAADLLGELLVLVRDLDHQDSRGESFRITASAGAAVIRQGSRFDEAVGEAQALLEEAMESGGNVLAESTSPEETQSILIAEDDPLSAAILQHRLEREGFKVLHFLDGTQALEGALANNVALAILDVKMPGMDGFELLERLRNVPAYFDLPIMMLTSMGREEDVARGFDLGADDYMVKPFSPVEVLARVRRLLNR